MSCQKFRAIEFLPLLVEGMIGRHAHHGHRRLSATVRGNSLKPRRRILCNPLKLQPQRCASTVAAASTTVNVHNLLDHGQLSYPQTWAYQQVVLQKRLQARKLSAENSNCVVFWEPSPVYTLGRGADENHLTFQDKPEHASEISEKLSRKVRGPGTARLSVDRDLEARIQGLIPDSDDSSSSLLQVAHGLTESVSPVMAPNGVPVYRVDRGGEVTFHGPSQLVVYPMLDLKQDCYKADLHWYLRKIEDVVIQTLECYNIQGNRDSINTGVWVGPNKICAVGISSSRWITTHGFALNVNPNLDYFDTSVILPCGIEGRGVTSMRQLLQQQDEKVPTIAEVAGVVTEQMQDVFGVEFVAKA